MHNLGRSWQPEDPEEKWEHQSSHYQLSQRNEARPVAEAQLQRRNTTGGPREALPLCKHAAWLCSQEPGKELGATLDQQLGCGMEASKDKLDVHPWTPSRVQHSDCCFPAAFQTPVQVLLWTKPNLVIIRGFWQ